MTGTRWVSAEGLIDCLAAEAHLQGGLHVCRASVCEADVPAEPKSSSASMELQHMKPERLF